MTVTQKKLGGENEVYPTPRWVTRLLWRDVPLPTGGTWLEPCVGEGDIVFASPWSLNWMGFGDVRETEYGSNQEDLFLLKGFDQWEGADNVITNPPFSKAQELIDYFWPKRCDQLVLLLPFGLLGSQRRVEWWQGKEPNGFYPVVPRPRFVGGKGDRTDCAWYVWSRYMRGQEIRILDGRDLQEEEGLITGRNMITGRNKKRRAG